MQRDPAASGDGEPEHEGRLSAARGLPPALALLTGPAPGHPRSCRSQCGSFRSKHFGKHSEPGTAAGGSQCARTRQRFTVRVTAHGEGRVR